MLKTFQAEQSVHYTRLTFLRCVLSSMSLSMCVLLLLQQQFTLFLSTLFLAPVYVIISLQYGKEAMKVSVGILVHPTF